MRAAGLGLLAAAVVLWGFAGFTWRVPAAALGGVVVARLLLLPLFPRRLRAWLGPLVLAATFLYLLTQVSGWAWGITLALVGTAVGVVRLPRWRVLAASVAVGVVCAAGLLVSGHESAVQQQLQQAQGDQVDASRELADDPTLLLSSLTTLIVSGDTVGGCFYFSPAAQAQFAASVGARDCPVAISVLHQQVRDPARYQSPRLPPEAITRGPGGEMATVNACVATWGPAFEGSPSDGSVGPRLGVLTLVRQHGNGYLVTRYTGCGG